MNQMDAIDFRIKRFEVKQWWNEINDFWEPVVELIPIALTVQDDAHIDPTIADLKQVYTIIQQMPCPDFGDSIYTAVTRTIILLIEVFEAVSQYNFSLAEHILQDAHKTSQHVYESLEGIGIHRYS